jgi:hypothetical protein
MIAAIHTLLVLYGIMVESIQRHAPSQQPTTWHDKEGRDIMIPPQKSHSNKKQSGHCDQNSIFGS